MSIPDYDALRAAVENEENILGLIGLPDYSALRAAVENEENILGLLNAAVQNSGTQFEEKRVRWVTINGRHIPMRDKDAGGGGGSSADNGLTSSGSSGIIIHKENEDFIFEDQKITKFLLKPGAKHYKEFVMVGYSENDCQKLYDEITDLFDKNKLVYDGLNSGGNQSYNLYVKLGVTKKKNFLLNFEMKNQNYRFVTAHMIKGDD